MISQTMAELGRLKPAFRGRMVQQGGPDGCIEWQGSHNGVRYGKVRHEGRIWLTHRLAYELTVGPISKGLVLDHLCRNPPCMNPAHLEPVTTRENTLRGEAVSGDPYQCRNGHLRTPENTTIGPRGQRICRTCRRDRQRRYKERRAAIRQS